MYFKTIHPKRTTKRYGGLLAKRKLTNLEITEKKEFRLTFLFSVRINVKAINTEHIFATYFTHI